MKKASTRAYTMPELVMIIVIIAILAAVAFTTIGNILENSRIKASEKEMMELVKAIVGDADTGMMGFVAEVGRYPEIITAASSDFHELYNIGSASPYNPFTRTGWNGPYIDLRKADVDGTAGIGTDEFDILYDSWGNAYQYDETNKLITSNGPDEIEGSSDDIVVQIED